MKSIQKVFILLAFSASTLQASLLQAGNFKGCVSVVNGVCQQCYRRKVLPKGAGCGPLQPASDTCQIYIQTQTGPLCLSCKKGYSNAVTQPSPGQFTRVCRPGTISYCLDESTHPDGSESCDLCAEGRYSVTQSGGSTDACLKIRKPVPHCADGSLALVTPTQCGVCDEGYAVGDDGQCLPSPQKGCWYATQGRCSSCNPFAGYSMNAQGNCFQ